MKIALIYLHVCAPADRDAPPAEHYLPWSHRFIQSYRQFPPTLEHDLVVVATGVDVVSNQVQAHYPEAKHFLTYQGGGWDIGAHQYAVRRLHKEYDLVICAATPVYFVGPNFLERMAEAFSWWGDGFFGPMASYEAWPHIRTCCWAARPQTFIHYPHTIDTRPKTFRAESGQWNISQWYEDNGYAVRLVTPVGDFPKAHWRQLSNIFRRGDQSNCLVWDRHCDLYAGATAEEKIQLEKKANGE